MSNLREWVTLSLIPGVGPHHFLALCRRFGSPGAVLNAGEKYLREVPGIGPEIASRVASYRDAVDVDGEFKKAETCGARFVTLESPEYPLRLAEIPDPPIVLRVRGNMPDPEAPAVAVVGTRKATAVGRLVAERLGMELAAKGIVVISGLARGIDTAAHQGALQAQGRTTAVLGCGVDVVYPRENEELMARITETGAVVSEFPMGFPVSAGNFPYRNRVISGMSLGTVVVEADERSGALITARKAMEQNREVFAVPGSINTPQTRGTHALIKDGAKLVENADDVMEEIARLIGGKESAGASGETPSSGGRKPNAGSVTRPSDLSAIEESVWNVLDTEPRHIDEVISSCLQSTAEVSSALTLLELKGLVRQLPGKFFVRRT